MYSKWIMNMLQLGCGLIYYKSGAAPVEKISNPFAVMTTFNFSGDALDYALINLCDNRNFSFPTDIVHVQIHIILNITTKVQFGHVVFM